MRRLGRHLLFSLCAAAPLAAGVDDRVLIHLDFEDRARGYVEPIPPGWIKLAGPGLPHYVDARLDDTHARSGRDSLRFDINGGSVIYRYPSGLIPVRRDAHYRVTVDTRATPMRHARAALTAYFADLDGLPLRDSVRRHDLPPGDEERWHELAIELTASHPKAAFLVVEIGILQPRLLDPDSARLPIEDIHGSAWFDDIRVAQVPGIHIVPTSIAGIFAADEPIEFGLTVSDRLLTDLDASVRVLDATGEVVYAAERSIAFDAASATEMKGRVRLPPLDPGHYHATFDISTADQQIETRTVAFARLAPQRRRTRADERFTINASSIGPESWASLPHVLTQIHAGRVKLPVWTDSFGADTREHSPGFELLVDDLQSHGIGMIGSILGLPPHVRTGVATWEMAVESGDPTWRQQLALVIARNANYLRQWQLLDDTQAPRFARDPVIRAVQQAIGEELRDLTGKPDLAMPWPAEYEVESGGSQVVLCIPSAVLPGQIPLYLDDLQRRTQGDLVASLEPLDPISYGRDVALSDFVQRIVYTLAGGATRIDMPLPTRTGRDGLEPTDLMPAMRTILGALSSSVSRGPVPLERDIEAHLFEANRRGMLVLWRTAPPQSPPTTFSLTLAGTPTLVTLDGIETPLAPAGPPTTLATQIYSLTLGAQPVILDNVDANLLRLLGSVRIDNAVFESSVVPHGRTISITNPYPHAVSGLMRFNPPDGWTISPPTRSFALNPGQTIDVPVSIEFPVSSHAGERTVGIELHLQADGEAKVEVPLSIRLGLPEVGLQSLALRDGADIVVQQIITNYGETPIDYTAFILCPGVARQERLVNNLGAGQTVIKRYRFPAPPQPVRVLRSGLREFDGTRALNEEVGIN
jgi:hypothetical protein